MEPPSLILARAAVSAGRSVWRVLPERARKHLENRAFYAIFQLTRVENDAYGWRPAPGPETPPADLTPPVPTQ